MTSNEIIGRRQRVGWYVANYYVQNDDLKYFNLNELKCTFCTGKNVCNFHKIIVSSNLMAPQESKYIFIFIMLFCDLKIYSLYIINTMYNKQIQWLIFLVQITNTELNVYCICV